MVFKRPVTSVEHLYLSGKEIFSDIVIQAIIEGKGILKPDELQDALIKVSKKFPGTCLRLHKNNWINDGEPAKVILLEKYPNTREHLSEYVNMHDGFDPQGGHTVEVELAQEDNRSLVIFRSVHAVMDGRGLEFWAKAVFATLRGEKIEAADSIMTDDTFTLEKRAPIKKDEPKIPRSEGPPLNADADIQNNFSFDYDRITLKGTDPAIVAKLGIGINKLLIEKKDDKGTMMVPVDLRQEISKDEPRSTGNLSLPVFITLEKDQTWSQLLSQLLSKLQKKKYIGRSRNNLMYRRLSKRMLGVFVKSLWNFQMRKGKYITSAVVSHVGNHLFNDYSSPGFIADSIAFIPCVMPIAPLSLVITESEMKTEIIIVKGQSLFDSPRATLEEIIKSAQLDHLITDEIKKKSGAGVKKQRDLLPEPLKPVIYKDAHLGLHELFERQVLLHGEKICLVFGEHSLSYSEVNAQSNKLAHYLISRGLNHGDFVGVQLERSLESIISILAIMKAGGVYVPLDPSIPENRLQYLIEDSKPAFIIIRATQAISMSHDVQMIHIEKSAEEIAQFSNGNPAVKITSSDLCYMIYTSGSTGKPKGAMNKHSSLTNHFLWIQETLGLNSNDATLHKTPCNFDASILEIFLALQCGAKIVIAKADGHKSTHYQLNEISKHRVTFIFSVPSVLNIMLDEIGEQENTTLRLILLGGEQFSMHLYEKLRHRFPQVSVHNLYGPAEAAIEVTTFDCKQEFEGENVPIGKAIANVETFVVDEDMNLVEAGTPGELIISGIAIGSGYFGKEELTGKMFIDHPFLKNSEHKAYRTGDIVRQLADGNLVFLGRKDNQVKIGGVRIELGEIEYHLQSIPWIDQAVVVGKAISSKQSNAQMTLIAYYSFKDIENNDRNNEIRLILRDKLPGYMVPSIYVEIDRLPLNASGKVDRLNLPDPNVSIEIKIESRDTWSETEKHLAQIWESVLSSPPNRNCNFFDMGGNSILAISLIEKINESFKCNLSAPVLYEKPDFADIVIILNKS